MRIGDYELKRIKDKILRELYQLTEEALNLRKIEIAELNRKYFLEPLQHIIDQLPIDLITHDTQYAVQINYTPADKQGLVTDENRDQITVDEKWEAMTDKPVINPKHATGHNQYSYHGGYRSKLDPKLYRKAAKLCDELLVLRKEKTAFQAYLTETTNMYKGSLQLRKVWPESLHKYLPAESTNLVHRRKKVSANKVVKPADPVAPTFLNTRLTTNLLEGK